MQGRDGDDTTPAPVAAAAAQLSKLRALETAVLRRARALEDMVRQVSSRSGADAAPSSPVPPAAHGPMRINRREGYVEVLLPCGDGGAAQLCRLQLAGMTERALSTYRAIHEKLLRRLSPEEPAESAETSSEQRRRAFFAQPRYAPPSVPRAATCSPASTSSGDVEISACPRAVEVVEVLDSLALPEEVALLAGSQTASGASTQQDRRSVGGGSARPPSSLPPTSQGGGTEPRSGTPSQVQREMEEFFPTPVTRTKSDEKGQARQGAGARAAKAAAAPPPPAEPPQTAVDSAALGPGRDLLRALYGGAPEEEHLVLRRHKSGASPPPPLHSERQGTRRAPQVAAVDAAARGELAEGQAVVSHNRSKRRRAEDYARFDDDAEYAVRTYGPAASTPPPPEEEPHQQPRRPQAAPPMRRRRAEENTPRQFWDITFSSPPPPPSSSTP